ncbi:MAG TPA: VWA domain-containing protein [Bacillota bacterium]|nr:VWA domain-containing protein [Bacillota bacterium]
MFIEFFFLLREYKLNVSIKEWLDLMEALDKGLAGPSLLDFYHLCRSVLVKSETDYDKFDLAFSEYFKDFSSPFEIPEEVWKWLNGGTKIKEELYDKIDPNAPKYQLEELKQMLEQRLKEQRSCHRGGNYWIGTEGTSVLGHGGFAEQGIRIGGESRYRSALQIANERAFRDFRQDNIIDTRQFQVALRKLRQYSTTVDAPKTELDIDGTIKETTENGGFLKLVFEKPRKNTVKLLLLFDSDGSMLKYSKLCSALFQAVHKANHFSDLKVYYFHNCIYEHLYTSLHCIRGEWENTEKALNTLGSEYRVIFIGDGAMAPTELFKPGGNCRIGLYNELPGIYWLQRIRDKYPHHIWLNPIEESAWDHAYGHVTINAIREMFPMFELSLDGLEKGIKKLLVNR